MDDEQDNQGDRPDATPQQPDKEPSNLIRLAVQATTLGWNLVIPIVGGVLLGRYLDDRFNQGVTWTLALLVLGVIVAFNNLYALYVEHGRVEPSQGRGRKHRQQEPGEDEHHAEDK